MTIFKRNKSSSQHELPQPIGVISHLSFYEELLTLGSHLRETERVALYKFLLRSKRKGYHSDARELMSAQALKKEIANGEILYSVNGDVLNYSARRKGETGYIENLRTLELSKIPKFRINKIVKFFAQSEVDVIWNYPVQGQDLEEEGSFSILSIPYFDLRYYSEGRGRIEGLINKLKFNETKILQKLNER